MKKKIRYGIAGFGAFAERTVAPAMLKSDNSALLAVQKRSQSAAEEKAKILNIPYAFDSAEQLALHPEIDAVYVASAVVQHKADVLAAARAGKHVLVEKPMAMNSAEAEEMITVCNNAGVKLMIGHLLRFSPALRRMKETIQSGSIGAVVSARAEYMFDARFSQRRWLQDIQTAGGGATFDIGVHCLDALRFVLNDEIVAVHSRLAPEPTKTATERVSLQSLQFSRGTVASIYASFSSPIRRAFLEVIGQEGILFLENFAMGSISVTLNFTTGNQGIIANIQREQMEIPNLCERQISAFSDSILTDSPSPILGEEGLKNQHILDQVMHS